MPLDPAEPPPPAFDQSRRLMGPNRWFEGVAVVLVAPLPWAHDSAVTQRWAARVRALAQALGWPEPAPQVRPHARGAELAFAAPSAALLTAVDVNEWAWEGALAQAAGAVEALGFAPQQPPLEAPEAPEAAAHFARRAADERSAPRERLLAAAAAHGLPVYEDDDTLSIGAGSGSAAWPRAALPLPLDVPWPRLHAVPTALITGSNGKTTTTRLLTAIARAAGLTPGLCSTEGVTVGDEIVEHGDYAGPAGARIVLRHSRVQMALLETARGGILRRGLAVQRADVAVLTNVSADHLGEYGIDTVEDIAELKLVVARAVQHGGTLVLNAGDATSMAVAARLPHACAARQALFAREFDHPALVAHRAAGGSTCGVRQGELGCSHEGVEHRLGRVAEMPLSMGGAAGYNIDNIAAAVLAAAALGVSWPAVRQALAHFGARPQDNPGRLERWPYRGATVLIDYAHNPDGLSQLLAVARALHPRRLGLLLGQAGNRDDAAIRELAHTAAAARPDWVVIKELPAMLRGRSLGEVPALLQAGLHQAGLPAAALHHESDELQGALHLLGWAEPEDVVVLAVHSDAARAGLHQALGLGGPALSA